MNEKSSFACTAIIPAYNRAPLIRDTLEALLSQDHPFAELIVVDDGSSDGTLAVVQSLDPRIRTISTSNRGVQHARNAGVAASQTEWVSFCDSDDIILPGALSAIAAFISENPEFDLVFLRAKALASHLPPKTSPSVDAASKSSLTADTSRHTKAFDPVGLERALKGPALMPTGMTIRRKAYADLGGYDTRFRNVGSEDLHFTLRAVMRLRTAVSREPLFLYRRHSDNDSESSVRQLRGEAVILRFLLKQEPALQYHHWWIQQSIAERLGWALGGAWAKRDYVLFREILSGMRWQDLDLKTIVQILVVFLPAPIRESVWKYLVDRRAGFS